MQMHGDVNDLTGQLEEEQRRATDLESSLDERRADLEDEEASRGVAEMKAAELLGRIGVMQEEQAGALLLWESTLSIASVQHLVAPPESARDGGTLLLAVQTAELEKRLELTQEEQFDALMLSHWLHQGAVQRTGFCFPPTCPR